MIIVWLLLVRQWLLKCEDDVEESGFIKVGVCVCGGSQCGKVINKILILYLIFWSQENLKHVTRLSSAAAPIKNVYRTNIWCC